LILSPGKLLRKAAPIKALIAPGMVSFHKIPLSTFLNQRCDAPDAAVVAISAICIEAEAAAGAIPNIKSNEEDVAPNPIPKEPSISWAKNPITEKIINFFKLNPPQNQVILYGLYVM
jgi:hypothetical protein